MGYFISFHLFMYIKIKINTYFKSLDQLLLSNDKPRNKKSQNSLRLG